jgi:hypothetical protein
MNPNSLVSNREIVQHDSRCSYASSDGRRCRMSRAPGHASLCFVHAREEQQFLDSRATTASLASPTGSFRTAFELNASLGQLYNLVAANRIPPRNAATLAYIGQLIMQTLPRVQSEVHSGYSPNAWRTFLHEVLDTCNSDPDAPPPSEPASNPTPPPKP